MGLFTKKIEMRDRDRALPGRAEPIAVVDRHFVLDAPLAPPYPAELELAVFGMGCFWSVERLFWQLEGVFSTAVGYAGGSTTNPTYEEVCSGRTGHNEVAQVVFDPDGLPYLELLRLFWEGHDPTQGMRQGNDVGSQYRSGIYTHSPSQAAEAESSRDAYRERLREAGYGEVTTEILEVQEFYFAEDYHQQYLAKNPMGYCGMGGTGVSCPIGLTV